MLSQELHPDQDSFALLKDVLHSSDDTDEKVKHLRDTLGDNVIVSGWINDPQEDNSPEAMIAALKERVEKFETNQHLRELEGQVTEEPPITAS